MKIGDLYNDPEDFALDNLLILSFYNHMFHKINHQIINDEKVEAARFKFFHVSNNMESKSRSLKHDIENHLFGEDNDYGKIE